MQILQFVFHLLTKNWQILSITSHMQKNYLVKNTSGIYWVSYCSPRVYVITMTYHELVKKNNVRLIYNNLVFVFLATSIKIVALNEPATILHQYFGLLDAASLTFKVKSPLLHTSRRFKNSKPISIG